MRWSGIARPRWMSGEVTSMPSLTRSGRPSFSLRLEAAVRQDVDRVASEVCDAHGGLDYPGSGALSEKSGAGPSAGGSASSDSSPSSRFSGRLGSASFTFGLVDRGRGEDPAARPVEAAHAGEHATSTPANGHTILAILRGSQARDRRPVRGDLAVDEARDRRDRGQALLRAPRRRPARHGARPLGGHHEPGRRRRAARRSPSSSSRTPT